MTIEELRDHWSHVMHVASANIGEACDCDSPNCEHDVKERIAYALKHGDCHEVAEVMGEAMEWFIAYHAHKALS